MSKISKENTTDETWEAIDLYPGYEASTLGNIRSLKRGRVKLCRLSINRGYYRAAIYKDGVKKNIKRSVLVAIAFHNHIPCGHMRIVDHKDDDRFNDKPDNLQILTPKENAKKRDLRKLKQLIP